MKSVEKDSVIHLSLQLWNEPWPYGMGNEKTELRLDTNSNLINHILHYCRRNQTDVLLHLIQTRFRNIFGEHYYRYLIHFQANLT